MHNAQCTMHLFQLLGLTIDAGRVDADLLRAARAEAERQPPIDAEPPGAVVLEAPKLVAAVGDDRRQHIREDRRHGAGDGHDRSAS